MRDFARRLIAHEAGEMPSSVTAVPAGFHVAEKLRPQLTALMGSGGYRALIARALKLASADVPWLRTLRVEADGTVQGLDPMAARLDPAGIFEGRVVLVAQVIGLLVAFIGEKLTLQLVREIWPKLPANDLNFSQGDRT
jgi:hypothetical protein